MSDAVQTQDGGCGAADGNASAYEAVAPLTYLSSSVAMPLGTCAILSPLLVLVGLLGNTVSIVVFRKLHLGIGRSALLYYTAIAVCEIWMLVHLQFINFFLGFGLRFFGVQGLSFWQVSTLLCRLHRFSYWFGGHVAIWLYVALSADRTIAIFTPIKSRYRLTRCRAIASLSAIVATGLALHGPICLGTSQINPHAGNWCDPGSCEIRLLRTFVTIYVLEVYLLPTAITTVLNAVLLCKTVSLSHSRVRLSAGNCDLARSMFRRREVARSVTVLTVCSVHIVFYWPFPILYCLYLYHEPDPSSTSEFGARLYSMSMLAHILTGVCYCMNFFIYFARIPGFKNAVLCRKSQRRKTTASM